MVPDCEREDGLALGSVVAGDEPVVALAGDAPVTGEEPTAGEAPVVTGEAPIAGEVAGDAPRFASVA